MPSASKPEETGQQPRERVGSATSASRSSIVSTRTRGPCRPGARYPESAAGPPSWAAGMEKNGEAALADEPGRRMREYTKGPSGRRDRRCARRAGDAGHDVGGFP
jgi:hypothetical protein